MGVQKTRIESLDIIRGIALLFIFIANIKVFSGYIFFDDIIRQSFSTYPLDKVLYAGITLFIDAKFYTIFSLLFGIGFYIQMRSFRNEPDRFAGYMSVRLLLLMMFGLFHMFFIWLGDIIALYALMGLILVPLRHLSDKALITLAIVMLFLPIANAMAMGIVGFYPGALFGIFGSYLQSLGGPADPTPGTPLQFMRTEDLWFYMQVKIADPMIRLAILLADGRFFKVFGILMLGLVIGRHIIHHNLLQNSKLLKKAFVWGLVIGLPANVLVLVTSVNSTPIMMLLGSVGVAIGTVPLSLAYAAAIVLLINQSSKTLTYFAPVGRMALTNYISQSVIGVLAYCGIGFGLIDQFGLAVSFLLVFVAFTAQILASQWWLSRHQQGPLEFLWRHLIPDKLSAELASPKTSAG